MKYFGGFSDCAGVMEAFHVPTSEHVTDEQIIFASYGVGDWDGDAYVLFQRDGELFSVQASHCSCYGLEDSWSPERTTLEFEEQRNEVDGWGHFLEDHEASPEDFSKALSVTETR